MAEMLAKEISDWALGVSLLINGCLFIPQAWNLFCRKNSQGVSLLTFGGFCIMQLVAIVNGYYHNDWAMVYGYGYSFITCAFVVLLISIYRFAPEKNRVNHCD